MKLHLQLIITLIILLGIPLEKAKCQSFGTLDINNIQADFSSSSSMFWNQITNAKFEVPKGSGKHTIFAGNFWVGGLNNGALHLAADSYSLNGKDFFQGPVMDSSAYSTSQDALWDRVWKVDKSMITNHQNNFSNAGYSMPQVFIDWPAHGDVSLGQAFNLAPFFDYDQNGTYDPYQGDYPLIKGDQAVFILFNDDRAAHGSYGTKLRIEVHVMAYAFDCSQDSALDHTIFMNYNVFNRSSNNYDSTYVGTWLDMDLGFYDDDFVACDVQRGSYYTYNGLSVDGTSGPGQYGANPPAQACVILKGPIQDADGTDNAIGIGPGESLNGYGFGDGIIDNESLGMSHFLYHAKAGSASPATEDPQTATDYYNYLKGTWKDGTKMKYGGNGHVSGGGTGPDCSYMFPMTSDPLGWGTGGVPQADWSEMTSANVPADRRGVMSSGPFTLSAGSMQSYDLAFVFGRDYDSTHGGSINVMNERIDDIRSMFIADLTTCGGSFTGISKKQSKKIEKQLYIYPNPANNQIIIEFPIKSEKAYIEIYDMTGRLAFKGYMKTSFKNKISLNDLDDGMYILNVIDGTDNYKKKFLKMRN